MKRVLAIFVIGMLAFPGIVLAQHHSHGGHGHSNQPGNHGGSYNPPSHPGSNHGPNSGPGWNNTPSYPSHPGHGHPQPPSNHQELRQSFRQIKGLFNNVMSSFHPFMNPREIRDAARTLGMLSRELSEASRLAPMMYGRDLRNMARDVDGARFTLVTENSPREASRKVRWTENEFDRLSDRIFGR